jgi:hypothetical protein
MTVLPKTIRPERVSSLSAETTVASPATSTGGIHTAGAGSFAVIATFAAAITAAGVTVQALGSASACILLMGMRHRCATQQDSTTSMASGTSIRVVRFRIEREFLLEGRIAAPSFPYPARRRHESLSEGAGSDAFQKARVRSVTEGWSTRGLTGPFRPSKTTRFWKDQGLVPEQD